MMARFHLQRLYVAQVQDPADPPPTASVASLNTHDLRPFAGFLKGLDIDDRIEHRFMEPGNEEQARAARRDQVRQVTAALVNDRLLGEDDPLPEELLDAWLRRLGAGPSRFVMVNAEDLWLETRAQNVPGTSDARPNWVGRTTLSLEDMEQSDRITAMLRRLDAARRSVEEPR
jgi:4-alpha-glucanotransferase